jgi:hypothetical protein
MFKLLNNFSVNNEDNLEDLEQSNDWVARTFLNWIWSWFRTK